jgi:PAB-dependent poly(A)-specific ribonuclease subunit 3
VLKFAPQVFHQADGSGRPVIDLGHVITCLNKLDAADEEKIVLTSRDGKSMFVVSYTEVARCLDNAFNECCGANVMGALHY